MPDIRRNPRRWKALLKVTPGAGFRFSTTSLAARPAHDPAPGRAGSGRHRAPGGRDRRRTPPCGRRPGGRVRRGGSDPPVTGVEQPRRPVHGLAPVFQWEIDPADPSLESGEASVKLGDWEYEVWFQMHPVGLMYVSIQAMDSDSASGPERQHPLGRNVVVNLVYDRRRAGVVAIYGTARDFRPFVEAFRIACGLDDEQRQAGKGEIA